MSVLRGIVPPLTALASAATLALVPVPASAAGPADYVFASEWQTATDFDHRPVDLAVAPNGRIHTLSETNVTKARVQVYDASGGLLQTWPDIDHDDPMGIAIGPGGQVYVTDMFGEQFYTPPIPPSVKVYTASGGFVRQYGLSGDASTWTAGGIAVAADGTSYVTDPGYGKIHKFAVNGTHVGSFGSEGGAVGQFNWPTDVDIAPNGNLVVADTDNARIQVLNPSTGAVVRHWGQLGTGPGQFDTKVNTVEVRSDGHVYVGDDSDLVKVFTAAGKYVGAVHARSALATQTGSIDAPTGLAFGPDRSLYVAGSFTYLRYGVARYTLPVPKGKGSNPKASGKAKVAKGTVRLKKKLRLRITCAKAARCTGKVRVTLNGKAITKPKKYAIKAGKKKNIKVKVTKKGRKLLRKQLRRKKAVRVVAVANSGAKRTTTRTKLKVRR